MLKYANRTLALMYVIGWLVWAISRIGEPGSGEPITWVGAWLFGLLLATAAWLGWQARREAEHD